MAHWLIRWIGPDKEVRILGQAETDADADRQMKESMAAQADAMRKRKSGAQVRIMIFPNSDGKSAVPSEIRVIETVSGGAAQTIRITATKVP
jgi:hypothetical protein